MGHVWGPSSTAKQSLAVQARWLLARLEFHILGNHLFSNAKALIFAGLFFEGEEADKWLKRGLGVLEEQVPEQILSDGGHFERSTMYHAAALEDFLDLINIGMEFRDRLSKYNANLIEWWTVTAKEMMFWLRIMSHPDGEIAFFNDAAFDGSSNVAELTGYAAQLFEVCGTHHRVEESVVALSQSGYIRANLADMALIVDVAKLGPDYLLGHAHADTLSFELSFMGERLFVNSGTSCYGTSNERVRQRGTAAHNTVIVDGVDSSEVWKGFRVAARAYPADLKVHRDKEDTQITVSCAHTGYHRLRNRPTHHRTWHLGHQTFAIEDRVIGPHHSAKALFHIHPEVQLTVDADGRTGAIRMPGGGRISWRVLCGEVTIEPSTWHPRFGLTVPNQCLVITAVGGTSRLELSRLSIQ